MSSKPSERFFRIEESQAALRTSIERAKALAAESERLIMRHRSQKETASRA